VSLIVIKLFINLKEMQEIIGLKGKKLIRNSIDSPTGGIEIMLYLGLNPNPRFFHKKFTFI